MRRKSKFAIGLSAFGTLSACIGCGNHDNSGSETDGIGDAHQQLSTDAEDSEVLDAAESEYRHPLRLETDQELLQKWLDTSHGRGTVRTAITVQESVLATQEQGRGVRRSGLIEVPRRKLSAQERAERAGAKRPRIIASGNAANFGRNLAELMKGAHDNDEVDVMIAVKLAEESPVFSELEDMLARRIIVTEADLQGARLALIAAKQERIAAQKAGVLELIAKHAGRQVSSLKNSAGIATRLSAKAIQEVARDPRVRKVFQNIPLTDEHGGRVVRGAHQVDQFIDANFDGQGAREAGVTVWDQTFAQVESNGADNEHLGFLEEPGGADRIRNMYNCSSSSCSSTTNFSTSQESDHASSVASIIFGDLSQGQDPAVTNTNTQLDRTGMSPEAQGYLVRASFSNRDEAFDFLVDRNPQPAVVNLSAGSAGTTPDCQGDADIDEAVNAMFEAGTLLIKSAGNAGHSSSSTCTVTAPGSAIGAFTVGGVGNDQTEASVASLKGTGEYSSSSRGGTSSDGKRTIVDVAANACRQHMYSASGGVRSGCGTSYAAPTVTGTALSFIDWYKVAYSNLIDNPGILFANLLLMGDRQDVSESKMTKYFDNVTGAGHLRARRFDSTGLDNPMNWATGSVCVGDDEEITIDVPGGVLSSDVDAFNSVIYWYDARHGTSNTLDDIDLLLHAANVGYLDYSIDEEDNKERISYQNPGGYDLSIRIQGWDVTADSTGCGTNHMLVYYAFYYEDSDRESWENLDGIDPI